MAFENFNSSFSSSDEEKKKKEGGDAVKVSSPERFGGFNTSFDVANPSRIKNPAQTQQELPDTSPVEDTGLFGRALQFGGAVVKGGLNTLNWLRHAPNKYVIQPIAEPLSNTKFMREAGAGLNAIESGEVEGDNTFSFLAEELLSRASNPLKAMEAPFELVGTKKAALATEEATSNIPIKILAGLQATGEQTYQEALDAWMVAREDANNPTWKKFLYEVQDAVPQSLIGTAIAIGAAYSLKKIGLKKLGITVGIGASSAYYTALSAAGQYQEKGKVDSIGNITIDVVGDQILNSALLGLFKVPAKTLVTSVLQGMGIEGGTEVAQTLLKLSNDYANAENQKEKDAVLSQGKQYFTSGGILMEFGVGGVAGGIATGVNFKYGGGASTEVELSEPTGSVGERIQAITDTPSEVTLYRGQVEGNDGVHFTDSPKWSTNFGDKMISGTLPADAKIYTLTEQDLKISAELGATTDAEMYQRFFDMGYDALVGVDTRNNQMVDVVVNPDIAKTFSEVKAPTKGKAGLDSNYIPNKGDEEKEGSVARGSELSFDKEAVTEYRAEVATMDESGDVTSQRYRDLQDFFTDYSSAFYDRTAYVPSSNAGAPLLEVVTVPFPDGKVAVRYGANTPFNSVNVGYNYGKLYGSKDEATQAALTDIQNWATEQRTNAQDARQQASYDRILKSAKNPKAETESLIASEVERQKKQELTRRRKEFIQQRDEQMEALGAGNLSGSQKTQLAFERSAGQTRVGTMGTTEVVIGSYGVNAIERKTKNGQDDRVSADELPDALKNVKRLYRAGDSGFRTDNMVAIAEMEDGSRMAIILRKNAKGQEEVINFFKIGRDADVFEENLKQFGAPERSRTSIASLEPTSPNPLEDKGTKSVSRDATTVKGINKKVSKNSPKYQRINETIKEAGGYISNEEAEKIVWSLFDPTELNVNFVNRLTTDKGNGAWGMWWDNAITMVRNPHWSTPYHESTHAYISMFMEKGEKKTLYDAIRKTDKKEYTDREAEEAIADGFVDYVRETRTFTGKLKDFFERVKAWIRDQFPQIGITPQPVMELYRNMVSRKRPDTEIERSSRVISTDMVEVSLAYQDAKDFTVKFLSSPMLQGRPKFSAQYIKDSVRSGKFPINEKEQRFVNEVIDAHFAGKKDITIEELTSAIEGDMLPMQVVQTSKWANYGMSEEQVGGMADEVRNTYTYVVGAGRGVEPFMDYNGRAHGFEKEVSGFMFHFRVAETNEGEGMVYNVIEIQSDPFQKDLFADDKNSRQRIGMVQTHLPVGKMNDIVNKVLEREEDNIMPFAYKATVALREANDTLTQQKEVLREQKEDLKKAQTVFDELRAGKLEHANKGYEEALPIKKLESRLKDGIIKKRTLGSRLGQWWGFRDGQFGYDENDVFRTQEGLADIMEEGLINKNWEEASEEYKEQNEDRKYEIEPFFEYAQKQIGETELKISVAKTTIDTSMELLEGYANGELTDVEKNQYASFQKFKGYKDKWYELATRVAIHVAARDGAVKVRFPSAYTMTRIESWDSQSLENGGGGFDRDDVDRSDVGDTIEVYGEDIYITNKYGDGSFEGTDERPDSYGDVDDVKDSEEQNLRDDWEGMLRDDMEATISADREGVVDTFKSYIAVQRQIENDHKGDNEQKVKESEAEVEIIRRDGAYIGQHGKNHQINDIANAFEDIAEGGRYNTSSFRLYASYGTGIFAGMTIEPTTTKAEVYDSLLAYEARRYTEQDRSFIMKLLLAGSESEAQDLYNRMERGEVQIEVVRFPAEESKKKEAQERLADYGKAVGADTSRSMMGSTEGDGKIDAFYGILIKNEPMKDSTFFTEAQSRAKIPALIEKQVAEYQSDAQKYRERAGYDEMNIANLNKKERAVEKWLETEKEIATQEQWVVIKNDTGLGIFTSITEERAKSYASEDPEKYTVKKVASIGDEIDGDYIVGDSEIVDELDFNNNIDSLFIEKFIDARMEAFDPVQWVEDLYRYVYWNDNKTSYIAYDSDPNTRMYEPSDYDGTDDQIESMREEFERQTDLTKKSDWFGSLDDSYQGAAYRYEVDIPRYLKKYRKENVEPETAYGFTWTSYSTTEDDEGGIPLYQAMPVEVEGKVRQSRAYQRVFDRLKNATEGDANYNQMSIAKDTASALAFVKANPEGASKVALGVLPPPEGITETAISIAVAEQAASQDNFELQAEVERSRSLRQTRRGQEIVAEKGRFNQNSPAHFIGQVLDARLEHLRGSYPRFALKNSARKDASAIIDAETVTLRKKMKKQQEKTQLAQQVIDLLTC